MTDNYSHTFIIAPHHTAMAVVPALQFLYAAAGITNPDARLFFSESAEEAKQKLDMVLIDDLAYDAAIAFGATINTFDLDVSDLIPGEIRNIRMSDVALAPTRVLYLPSLQSSWWQDEENQSLAIAAIKTVSSTVAPYSNLFRGHRITDLDIEEVEELDISIWN